MDRGADQEACKVLAANGVIGADAHRGVRVEARVLPRADEVNPLWRVRSHSHRPQSCRPQKCKTLGDKPRGSLKNQSPFYIDAFLSRDDSASNATTLRISPNKLNIIPHAQYVKRVFIPKIRDWFCVRCSGAPPHFLAHPPVELARRALASHRRHRVLPPAAVRYPSRPPARLSRIRASQTREVLPMLTVRTVFIHSPERACREQCRWNVSIE